MTSPREVFHAASRARDDATDQRRRERADEYARLLVGWVRSGSIDDEDRSRVTELAASFGATDEEFEGDWDYARRRLDRADELIPALDQLDSMSSESELVRSIASLDESIWATIAPLLAEKKRLVRRVLDRRALERAVGQLRQSASPDRYVQDAKNAESASLRLSAIADVADKGRSLA